MKLTICGSIAFIEEIKKLKEELELLGHQVKIPASELADEKGDIIPASEFRELKKKADENSTRIWSAVNNAILTHFSKIAWADAILVANYDKKDIPGYVGGNTLMEIGVATFLNRKAYMLNPIPDMPYKEEMLACKPVIINRDLESL